MYRIDVCKTASKELFGLPKEVVNRVLPEIKGLSTNPRPVGCKKLKGHQDTWRIRIGDYRVIYSIDDVI